MSKFRILSLDGGGIRGAATAGFLAEIERKIKGNIADYFDLIAGTSTGAIIAVALALGVSAQEIEKFYLEKGPAIFCRAPMCILARWPLRLTSLLIRILSANHWSPDTRLLFKPKYDAKVLRAALLEVMGNSTIGHAKRRLVIPSVDLTKGETVVFKTPHNERWIRDLHYQAVDVVLASTAAPTYFSPAQIAQGSAYADGGLWANNPAICAYVEAIAISRECNREQDPKFEPNDISMLSVGTGISTYFLKRRGGREGIFHWGLKTIDVMGGAQSQGVNHQMRYLMGDQNYCRANFNLPDKWPLDAVDKTAELVHLGQQKAIEMLADIRERFLAGGVAPEYTPYSQLPVEPAVIEEDAK